MQTMNLPEPLDRWLAFFLSCIAASWILGMVCVFAGVAYRPVTMFAQSFFVICGTFGALHAFRGLRYHFAAHAFVKENAKMPMNIAVDPDSGYAAITTLDGTLTSLHLPPEVQSAGPQAVMDYVIVALEAD